MRLEVLQGEFGVARLDPNEATPAWAAQGIISSVTRTAEDLSVVCDAGAIPAGVKAERGWRCLRVTGRLDFSLTGILASIAGPLAVAKVSIFAISTYDTDYVLVPGEAMTRAIECLRAAGHEVIGA
ncbi:MAG: ACT domain-containing protein [Acidobacteriia bacterium]|nr:ACT domain-containing protein [Terriglobia bacterium]